MRGAVLIGFVRFVLMAPRHLIISFLLRLEEFLLFWSLIDATALGVPTIMKSMPRI